jgi:hypothetical protein
MDPGINYSTMPQPLLDQISEMSYGGYILFSFDQNAKPQVHLQIGDDLNAMSLQYFVKTWTDAMEEISRENFLQNISKTLRPKPKNGDNSEDYGDYGDYEDHEDV